jgi:hypothetical protein
MVMMFGPWLAGEFFKAVADLVLLLLFPHSVAYLLLLSFRLLQPKFPPPIKEGR